MNADTTSMMTDAETMDIPITIKSPGNQGGISVVVVELVVVDVIVVVESSDGLVPYKNG